jgi:hypothetical protein
MLFNIEDDFGDRVVGYLVPDGFSTNPTLRVSGWGNVLMRMPVREVRGALVEAGRHETGQCGFTIDTSMIPELADIGDLELHDDETGLLIYRRPHSQRVTRRVFRMETHLYPHWRLDDAFRPHFQYHLRGLETFGRETVTQTFLLNKVDSCYLSGRLFYKNYEYYLGSGFCVFVIVQDPYEEFAERLLILSRVKKISGNYLSTRDAAAFDAAIDFAETLPFHDDKALTRALRRMSPDVTMILSDPLTRQLTSTRSDEMPNSGSIAAALDLLSSFALVGLRHRALDIQDGLGELFGIDPKSLPPLPQFGAVAQLAHKLRHAGVIDGLLERDREIYYHLSEAFDRSSTVPQEV